MGKIEADGDGKYSAEEDCVYGQEVTGDWRKPHNEEFYDL
jgi:hypothetical protein